MIPDTYKIRHSFPNDDGTITVFEAVTPLHELAKDIGQKLSDKQLVYLIHLLSEELEPANGRLL